MLSPKQMIVLSDCSSAITVALSAWVDVELTFRPASKQTEGLTSDKSVWFDMASIDLINLSSEDVVRSWEPTDSYGRFLAQFRALMFSIPNSYWVTVKKQFLNSIPKRSARRHVSKLLKTHPELILIPLYRKTMQSSMFKIMTTR